MAIVRNLSRTRKRVEIIPVPAPHNKAMFRWDVLYDTLERLRANTSIYLHFRNEEERRRGLNYMNDYCSFLRVRFFDTDDSRVVLAYRERGRRQLR